MGASSETLPNVIWDRAAQLAVLPSKSFRAFAGAFTQTFNVKYFYFAAGAANKHRGVSPRTHCCGRWVARYEYKGSIYCK